MPLVSLTFFVSTVTIFTIMVSVNVCVKSLFAKRAYGTGGPYNKLIMRDIKLISVPQSCFYDLFYSLQIKP